jgi:SWI/SNF-related matrix-associated actin-dependent regulator 1 of chromatin subfamily A
MGTIQQIGGNYLVRFDFDKKIAHLIKGAKSARMAGKNEWMVPIIGNEQVIQTLLEQGFTNLDEVTAEQVMEIPPLPELTQIINLKVDPYDFQKLGIAYSITNKRLIIGDKPGLGKTIQAMATVVALNAFPCLVICPASLKYNWKKEWESVTHERAELLTDGIKNTWPYF